MLFRSRDFYADARAHARLMRIVERRLGHALAAAAEAAKIAVAAGSEQSIDLGAIEAGLAARLTPEAAARALDADLQRIVDAALVTARSAGVEPGAIDALYFTGGSTGLAALTARIAAAFPRAQAVHGERFASVAQGLGEEALRRYG